MSHPLDHQEPTGFDAELIVVGGGIAGLTAAALVAHAGHTVMLIDGARHLGGRAITNDYDGVHFNLGPHALYCHGHATRLLKELEVPFAGSPPSRGRYLSRGTRLDRLPAGLGELIASRLLTIREKFRLVRFLSGLSTIDTPSLDTTPLDAWIRETAGTGNLEALLRTLFRVATYVDDHRTLSAGAALEQFRIAAAGNVWYLDGGWQTLIDGLRDAAGRHGATLHTGAAARRASYGADGVTVELLDGRTLRTPAGMLAVDPTTACKLLPLSADAPLARWNADRIPVRAACLDIALRRLPRSERFVVFDLERPHYFSVHSAAARLGPPGVAVVHVAKYLGGDGEKNRNREASPRELEAELEQFLDRVQPGWRSAVVARRFLPSMTVTHALPRADEAGLAGRPATTVAGHPGWFLAGDWVGPRGMLADASAASAEEGAQSILRLLAERRNGPVRRTTDDGGNFQDSGRVLHAGR